MQVPLIDVDANLRQPGLKATKTGSKIPSPPKIQYPNSIYRRNPFSVSATDSPRHSTMPTDCNAAASPTPASKLPRKSIPTQSAFSKSFTYGSRPTTPRASLPRARNWPEPAAIVTHPSSDLTKTTSLLSCNKPLPIPPIAQLVNPASPPKAHRTLVDAEAGTPTEHDWPVLQPETMTLATSPTLLANEFLPQRSISKVSALRRHGTPVLKSHVTTPLSVNGPMPSHKRECMKENTCSTHQTSNHRTETCALIPTNPCAKSCDALSTSVTIDMPLALRQQGLPDSVIPPRISSNRNCLPSLHDSSAQPPALNRPGKSSFISWPGLVAIDQTTKALASGEATNDEQSFKIEPDPSKVVSFDGADIARSYYSSIDSASQSSSAVGSQLDDEVKAKYKSSFRIKRLSWKSSNPGSGPTLSISADADAILLGADNSFPKVSALPDTILRDASLHRDIGISPESISKQVLVSAAPTPNSRAMTPSSTEKGITGDWLVEITPIRSMQPPRGPSTGELSGMSTPSGTPTSTEVIKSQKMPHLSQARPRSFFEDPQRSSVVYAPSVTQSLASERFFKNDCKSENCSIISQDKNLQEHSQILDTVTVASQSAPRKRLPTTWTIPRSATFFRKEPAATRSKASPLLRSTERAPSRSSAVSSRSTGIDSFGPSQSMPSRDDTRQLRPSWFGTTRSVARDLDSVLHDVSSNGANADEPTAADDASRLKAKRSFRNIFPKHDSRVTTQMAKRQGSKRSSVAGNALAKRIRNTSTFSKISLVRPAETNPGFRRIDALSLASVEASGREINRLAALDVLKPCPAETLVQHTRTARASTADVIHNILDRVNSMKKDSPDRLRGVEVAEAVLRAVECSKKARLSAELARKHACDAESSVEQAGLELKRLEMLCEPGFDEWTMAAIRHLIMSAGFTKSSAMAEP